MTTDLVIRDIRYGIELVDALTREPVIGPASVSITGQDAVSHSLPRSRWAFERLAPGIATTFDVEADLYLPRIGLAAGTSPLPAIPDDDPHEQGAIARVELEPRTGYPFPAHLTRIVGAVTYLGRPVVGATVTVTPAFGAEVGLSRATQTADDGQYTVWFQPDPMRTPSLPTGCGVSAVATIDGERTGARTGVVIDAHRVCGVAVIELT